jgi:predicted O-methyltransferase YrrM
LKEWIQTLLANPDMLRMGHAQSAPDGNLGLGFVYYGLARALRIRTAVVVGSWRGFVPLVLGKAIMDNVEGGNVVFIDPSLVDDFWTEPSRVAQHFASFGVSNIGHFCMTTQAFVATPEYESLTGIGLLFIDGLHTLEQARFDYESFAGKLADNAVVLFHDSIRVRESRIYGEDRPYQHRVKDFVDLLRQDSSMEVFDLPVGGGVTLARKRSGTT